MSRAFPLCRDGEHRLRVRPLPNARASTSMLARGPVRCARRSRCDHAIAAHPGCSPTSKLAQCEATGHPIAICAVFESASGLVRAENLVHGSDQHGCSFGRPAVMISDHVAAVRVSPVYAGRRGVAAVAARGGVEDRGDLDPAPPARGAAAPTAAATEAELGGPGPARCPAQRHTQSTPPGAAAASCPGNDRAMAPRRCPPPLGRPVHTRGSAGP
jgi:hypothetical protein